MPEEDQRHPEMQGPANQAQVWLAEILIPQGQAFWLSMGRKLQAGELTELDVNDLHALADPNAAQRAENEVRKKLDAAREALELQAEAAQAFLANPK